MLEKLITENELYIILHKNVIRKHIYVRFHFHIINKVSQRHEKFEKLNNVIDAILLRQFSTKSLQRYDTHQGVSSL
jgi:hypothetical protein